MLRQYQVAAFETAPELISLTVSANQYSAAIYVQDFAGNKACVSSA